MAEPIRVLLTGAGGPATRNVIRSLRLAKQEYFVVGTDRDKRFIAASGADQVATVPSATDPAFVATIKELVAEHDVAVVHPQPDPEVQVLAAHAADLPTGLPPVGVIETCSDKLLTADALTAAGVGVPLSMTAADLGGAFSELASLGDGVVWVRARRGAGARASLPTRSVDEARAWMDYWTSRGLAAEDFMLAQFLPGREFAVQTLWWRGRLIGAQARERLEYLFGYLTPSGQTSSPSVARIVNDDNLYAIAEAAVRAVGDEPHGVFSVDMKSDAGEKPLVTEINAGRFFTTSLFLSTVGANFPDLLMRLVAGNDVERLGVGPVAEGGGLWVRSVDMEPMLVPEH